MQITYPDQASFCRTLEETPANSLDFILVVTAALDPGNMAGLEACLAECVRALKNGGLLFVQGRPDDLPQVGIYLDRYLSFKYWIAIESRLQKKERGLPSVHAAVLLFSKGNRRFNIGRVRLPHQYCTACKKPLRDWGGKTHLMHPDGHVISDVWRDLSSANNYTQMSAPALDIILQMLDVDALDGQKELRGVIGPKEGIGQRIAAEPGIQCLRPSPTRPSEKHRQAAHRTSSKMLDVVHCGDALTVLKRYPDHSIDLVFADPPYNLDKAYNVYDDERADEQYIAWCNAWLEEYARILKPTGSLYVLNLPHWTMYHAAFLSRRLCFQNWIVWDALSEPRGKLMPAHYGLLFYTKHPTDFTFNYEQVSQLDARHYCLRAACTRKRKAMGDDDKELLTDLWWNIHRIKHRRDRDYHPCQLPDALMERIIRLSTNPGDVVLDAFSGAGTTAAMAAKLGRRYVAMDIDPEYVRITQEKVAQVKANGFVSRPSVRKQQRPYTKKELQLELRDLASRLGRLPTPEDVQQLSKYNLQVFFEMFPTWGKALKAAHLEAKAQHCSCML